MICGEKEWASKIITDTQKINKYIIYIDNISPKSSDPKKCDRKDMRMFRWLSIVSGFNPSKPKWWWHQIKKTLLYSRVLTGRCCWSCQLAVAERIQPEFPVAYKRCEKNTHLRQANPPPTEQGYFDKVGRKPIITRSEISPRFFWPKINGELK